MTLEKILTALTNLDEFDVLYAERPWTPASNACVVRYTPDETVVRKISDSSLEYFLEASLIRDISSQVKRSGLSTSDVIRIIIYYAENDAFPEE